MTERLLQFIWQFQYFNRTQLTTAEGDELNILRPGTSNVNQGPDFLDARIKVNGTTWVGNIELHIESSNWVDHNHSNDTNYNNIILHVVWLNDVVLNLPFPVLELSSKVSKILLSKFDDLMNARRFIPCENSIAQVDRLTWTGWKERLLVERLQMKSAILFRFLEENNNHWEESFWWLLARNFGVSVNTDAFEIIARSLPLQLLAKHKSQLHQAEALLFGQAGLLNTEFTEAYPAMLKKEYAFYRNKYKLHPIQVPLHFLRMRPGNFPTVRLAQLAMLIHQSTHLLSVIRETTTLQELRNLFDVTANDYWHYHYTFNELSEYREKKTGRQMIDTLIINAVLPILFAYGHYHKQQEYKDRVIRWFEELQPEINKITTGFTAISVENKTAFDSQALIQLKHAYCDEKRCLECSVGKRLLTAETDHARREM